MMRRRVAALVCATLLASGCGVPLSETADPIPGAVRSASASPSVSGTADAAGTSSKATLWYVDGDRLVPRPVVASGPAATETVLALLSTTPAGTTRLVTLIADPLGGTPLVSVPTDALGTTGPSELSGAVRRIELSPTFTELTSQEQVLLIGQVVLTLTEFDPTPIQFVDGSLVPLSVPLPDGRLRDGPVTRGDYLSLR